MVHFLQFYLFLMFLCVHIVNFLVPFILGWQSYRVGVLCVGGGSRLYIQYNLSWIRGHLFRTVNMMTKSRILHFHWVLTYLYKFHFLYLVIRVLFNCIYFSLGSTKLFPSVSLVELSIFFFSGVSCFLLILSMLLMYLFVVVGLFIVALEKIFLRWLFVDRICILLFSSTFMIAFISLLRKLSIYGPFMSMLDVVR